MKLLMLGGVAVLLFGCEDDPVRRLPDGPPPIDAPVDVPPIVPRCGDGIVDDVLAEECDDGNTTLADGCEACKWAYACVLTHNGGVQASITSMLVDPNGNLFDAYNLDLAVNDNVSAVQEPLAYSPIAACGRRVYAVAAEAGLIVSVTLSLEALPALGATTPVPGFHSLVCDDTRSILYALTASTTSPVSTVRTYAVADDGALALVDTETVAFSATGTDGMASLVANVHPVTRDLWVLGFTRPALPGPVTVGLATRIATTAGGAMTVAEPPRDIGLTDLAQETVIRGDGAQLVMAGHSGGCTAVWELPATGVLPATADRIFACGGSFTNAARLAVRSTSNLHYNTNTEGALRVIEVDPTTNVLVDRGSRTIATGIGPIELAIAYDRILVAFASATGTVTSFLIGADETMLTAPQFDTITIPSAHIRGSVIVPCARPIPI